MSCYLLTLFFFSLNAEAHSGRTNSSGGHNFSSKSQAKGLCSGYHYHNGGGDSSDALERETNYLDKDCTDFNIYKEVVEYWNSNGYIRYNDPERLDGWGNMLGDGIPCEPPYDFDTSIINGSDEHIAVVNEEHDNEQGEQDDYKLGLKDEKNELGRNSIAEGTDAYQSAYSNVYSKGYEEWLLIFNKSIEKISAEGYEYGSKHNQMIVPKKYKKNISFKSAFEQGYDKASEEKKQLKLNELETLGYEDGLNYSWRLPEGNKDEYEQAYKEGYEEGVSDLKQKYLHQGYESAYVNIKYKLQNFNEPKFNEWYKEGFQSNEEVKQIGEAAPQPPNRLHIPLLQQPKKYLLFAAATMV